MQACMTSIIRHTTHCDEQRYPSSGGLKRHLTGRDPAVSFVCWLVPSTRHLRGPHRAGAYVSELGSQERMHKSCSRAQWWYTTVGVRTTIMELLLCPGLRLQ